MGLTKTEGMERLEYITVFTEVASKLSGNLYLFCTQPCKGKKKIGNVTLKNYLNESLLSLLCFIIYNQGSFEKLTVWCELSEIYLIAYALRHGLCVLFARTQLK